MTNAPQQPPAGWYPDPAGSNAERYWDGGAWSQSTRDLPQPEPHGTSSAPGASPYGAAPGGYGSPAPYGQPSQGGYGAPGYGPQYGGYGQPMGAPQGPPLAGFWWRVLGYIIDGILIYIVSSIISALLGFNAMLDRATERWSMDLLIWTENPEMGFPMWGDDFVQATAYIALVNFVVWAIYRTVMYGTRNGTVGQLLLGMRLVKMANPQDKIDWGTAALRGIGSAVLYSITLVNLVNGLAAAFSKNKQTIADMIAKTQVYKVR